MKGFVKGTFASHPLVIRWYADIEAEVEFPDSP